MSRTTQIMRARDAGGATLESPVFAFSSVESGGNRTCFPKATSSWGAEGKGQLPLPPQLTGQEPEPGAEQAFFSY